jgi:translation initiation factor IF-3
MSGGGDRNIEREVRVNERIRAREVRVIDENGAQLGIMPSQQALQLARQRELDLIEVAPNAQPPVVRIMDYGKHRYEQQKREREAHKKSRASEVRLLRLKPQIDKHDLEIKVRKLRQMLLEGDKVRFQLRFRGREMARPQLGQQLLQRIAEQVGDIATVEGTPRLEGRMMNMVLAPKPGVRAPQKEPPASPKPEKEKGRGQPKAAPQEAAPAAPAAEAPSAPPAPEPAPPEPPEEEQKRDEWSQAENAEDGGEAG